MSDLDAMRRKIDRLRAAGAVDEFERRWSEEYAERYNDSRLDLRDPVDLGDTRPAALQALYALTDGARFGDIVLRPWRRFRRQQAVDQYGEPIDDRERTRIGSVGEDSILLDNDDGSVIVYCFTYFKYRWGNGILVSCSDLAEFVNTVALGPRYIEIKGPVDRQKTHWWTADPWYQYLEESGLARVSVGPESPTAPPGRSGG